MMWRRAGGRGYVSLAQAPGFRLSSPVSRSTAGARVTGGPYRSPPMRDLLFTPTPFHHAPVLDDIDFFGAEKREHEKQFERAREREKERERERNRERERWRGVSDEG